uniref:FAM13A-like domain-containing protein n=1 Tax=Daphnia galeata TaxID=27404 RepID=A0A8J2S2G9_9CRUS|nr:unnamed protein product [Daphnia galeata]
MPVLICLVVQRWVSGNCERAASSSLRPIDPEENDATSLYSLHATKVNIRSNSAKVNWSAVELVLLFANAQPKARKTKSSHIKRRTTQSIFLSASSSTLADNLERFDWEESSGPYMMRRRTSLEPYDIDNVPSQTLNESYQDDEETTNNGPTLQPDSKRTPCIPISHHAPVHCSSTGHPWSGGGLDDDSTDDRNDYTPWNNRNEDLVVASTVSVQDESDFDPMASITVQMSIWKELSAGQPSDENQSWTNDATLCWRRYPFALEDEVSSPISYGSPATYPIVPDEEVELVAADTERSEHEERRILERFASFPIGSKSRPVSILLGGGCGTPKGGRRRNKRKGCDSPRSSAEDKNTTTTVVVKPEASTPDILPAGESIVDPFPEECSNAGQGQFRQQLCFDLMQLQDKEEEAEEQVNCEDGDRQGNEPVTSHGMRPARGWASLNILPDEDDEDVTVSPRVLSPEMDEPAGSFHVRGFHGRCKEPQEKRTAFIALGNLNNLRNPNRNLVGTDEHPATLRARQLVQQIHSLKQKVKLYEDAFEQRYGYRPSHHQKMDDRNTKRVLTELARTRKELKQLKERYHLVEPVEISETRDPAGTTTTATFFTRERPSAPSTISPSVEETVLEVHEHLTSNRQLAGRSEAIDKLTAKEVLDEKLAVQRALLYVESLHGRPASFTHKDLLRPLYDRYRILKRMVVRSGLSRSKEEVCDLAPILEYETLELYETRPGGHRHSAPATPSLESMEEMDPRAAVASTSRQRHVMTPITGMELRKENGLASWNTDDPMLLMWKRQKISLNIDENLHALPLNQLMDQLRHVREEKRRLRRTIRDLEADMLRQSHQGPAPRYSSAGNDEDVDGHLEPVYAQYRHARAKLRLLEALVAKHDGSATL